MMELNRNYLPMYDWLDLLLVLCMHSFVINEKEKKNVEVSLLFRWPSVTYSELIFRCFYLMAAEGASWRKNYKEKCAVGATKFFCCFEFYFA